MQGSAPEGKPVPTRENDTALFDGVPQRVHHSYIWLGSLRTFIVIAFAVCVSIGSSIVGIVTEGVSGNVTESMVFGIIAVASGAAIFLTLGIIVLFQWLSYKHLYYVLSPTEFTLYQGILNKKQVHVPYARVQSVDQRTSLLQRIFGICSVVIDTAGGAANKAIVIPYVTKQAAETLRRELFARKGAAEAAGLEHPVPETRSPQNTGSNILDKADGVWQQVGHGVFAGSPVHTGKVTFETSLTNKQLFLTAISNASTLAAVIIAIFGVVMQVVAGIFDVLPSTLDSTYSALASDAEHLSPRFWLPIALVAAGGTIGLGFFVWAMSAVVTCLRFGGFKARRRDARIEVEHGILQHIYQGVDIDRVQAIIVKQTLLRRLMGYCEVSVGKVDAMVSDSGRTENRNAQSSGIVIHPFIKVSDVRALLDGLIPEWADTPAPDRQLAKVAMRRGIVRNCIVRGVGCWIAACTTVALLLNAFLYPSIDLMPIYVGFYSIAAVAFAVQLANTILWARGSSFGYDRRMMELDIGGLSRQRVTIPKRKIQFGYSKTNPLQRHAGTATINVRTAQGIGGSTVQLFDVSSEDAATWLDWLR